MQWIGALMTLTLLIMSVRGDDFFRKLTTKYNPNCPPDLSENRHVAYTRAVSGSDPSDVLHLVFSAGQNLGPPSLLLLRASGEKSRLTFNWTKMTAPNFHEKKGGIVLESGTSIFQSAYILQRVWEFNDTKDSANMSEVAHNSSLLRWWDADKFLWTVGDTGKIEKEHTMELTANSTIEIEELDEEEEIANGTTPAPPINKGPFHSGSKLQVRVVHGGKEMRSDKLPRLQFTGNSSQMDVVMDHLLPGFKGARFAVTFMQIASIARDGKMMVNMSESVDDEFTPGIFKMYNWKAVPNTETKKNKYDRSFVQWKPVCYTSPDRHLKMSQQMYYYPLPSKIDNDDLYIMERSVAFSLFGVHRMTPQYDAIPMNISFGQSTDGFYTAYNFTSWTASMGHGTPPTDKVSILVIMIIAIGLGLPVILMFIGSVYICIRRRRAPLVSYEQIN